MNIIIIRSTKRAKFLSCMKYFKKRHIKKTSSVSLFYSFAPCVHTNPWHDGISDIICCLSSTFSASSTPVNAKYEREVSTNNTSRQAFKYYISKHDLVVREKYNEFKSTNDKHATATDKRTQNALQCACLNESRLCNNNDNYDS